MFWVISWIPDSILFYAVNILLVVGAVSAFLSFFIIHRIVRWFPAIAPYHLIIQIVSAVLLVAGLYFKGGYGVEIMWRERVAELEAKVKESEEKAKIVNEKIVVEYRDRVRTVTETKVVIQEKIKEVEKIVDGQCKVAPEAVLIHNEAAKMLNKDKK
jgi:hypothetical protein